MAGQGECFEFAYNYIKDNGGTLFHAVLTNPKSDKKFWHAWVEKGDKIIDLQGYMGSDQSTRVRGQWYKNWKPTRIRAYGKSQAFIAMVKNKHYGPWGAK